ncbi:hypothetical protein GQ56_0130325 [Burkholderia paludis]|nr:hypothetical protein GQ56_0130325 [Burkholderia paludis]
MCPSRPRRAGMGGRGWIDAGGDARRRAGRASVAVVFPLMPYGENRDLLGRFDLEQQDMARCAEGNELLAQERVVIVDLAARERKQRSTATPCAIASAARAATSTSRSSQYRYRLARSSRAARVYRTR